MISHAWPPMDVDLRSAVSMSQLRELPAGSTRVKISAGSVTHWEVAEVLRISATVAWAPTTCGSLGICSTLPRRGSGSSPGRTIGQDANSSSRSASRSWPTPWARFGRSSCGSCANCARTAWCGPGATGSCSWNRDGSSRNRGGTKVPDGGVRAVDTSAHDQRTTARRGDRLCRGGRRTSRAGRQRRPQPTRRRACDPGAGPGRPELAGAALGLPAAEQPGCQIAEDLLAAGRQVILATR